MPPRALRVLQAIYRGTQRARRPSVSARRTRPPPQGTTAGGMGHARRCYAVRARRPRARPVGAWHQRPSDAPTPQRASAVPHAGRLAGSSCTGWPDADGQAGGKAAASTNGREAATSAWQAVVSVGTGRAPRSGRFCSPGGRCVRQSPIGSVSSSERVPRDRRRGEAAPLGRARLEWGSCLENRASGAPAGPPDPKVDDAARAFLPVRASSIYEAVHVCLAARVCPRHMKGRRGAHSGASGDLCPRH